MTDILLGHASLQIQDTPAQMRADARKVFARAVQKKLRWVTGTEANNNAAAAIIRAEAEAAGFWWVRGSDMWLAVPKATCAGLPEFEFVKVLDGVRGRFTDKGVLRASFVDPALGRVTVLVSHQLTLGQAIDFPGVNGRIARLVGELGLKYGKGRAKVFYAGDQNEDDRKFDTFDGQPFTSAADELGKHEGTLGSREVEVIASYDPDSLVKAISWNVFTDGEFFLHSDHRYVEAGYRILTSPPKPPATPPKPKPLDKSKLANPTLIGDGIPNRHSGVDGNKPIERIVIHSAVIPCEPGRARQLGQMNQTSRTGSWHYATDPKEAVQCSYDRVVCWHAPPNPNTIGIEMADWPKPWPTNRTAAALAAARRVWRWNGANHKAMLNNTARLTAELCIKYDLPIRFVTVAMLKKNPNTRGITTHAVTSQAFRQSTHWDPGFWPRRRFMDLVRKHAADILAGK